MNRLWKLCFALLVVISLPARAQALTSGLADWASRFDGDMRLAEARVAGEAPLFAQSQWPFGSSTKYLNEMHSAGQLFPKPRNRRVWSLGEALRFLAKESQFGGSGGTVVGAELNSNLPREELEVVYVRPPPAAAAQLESALKQRFGVDRLEVPAPGVLRRNAYPFLLFKRIDGKLYLAAFSKEFMAMVDAIFSLQIAEADYRTLGLEGTLVASGH